MKEQEWAHDRLIFVSADLYQVLLPTCTRPIVYMTSAICSSHGLYGQFLLMKVCVSTSFLPICGGDGRIGRISRDCALCGVCALFLRGTN